MGATQVGSPLQDQGRGPGQQWWWPWREQRLWCRAGSPAMDHAWQQLLEKDGQLLQQQQKQQQQKELLGCPLGPEGPGRRPGTPPTPSPQPRTFVFEPLLRPPSQLLAVSLERPLGVVFEESAGGRAVVAELTEGGNAEQARRCAWWHALAKPRRRCCAPRSRWRCRTRPPPHGLLACPANAPGCPPVLPPQAWRRARLNPSLVASTIAPGDVLRACTCTTITYQTTALLFGAQKPTRTISMCGEACVVIRATAATGAVLVQCCQGRHAGSRRATTPLHSYGADGQRWPAVVTALQKGLRADGPVTLVLERALEQQEGSRSGSAAA